MKISVGQLYYFKNKYMGDAVQVEVVGLLDLEEEEGRIIEVYLKRTSDQMRFTLKAYEISDSLFASPPAVSSDAILGMFLSRLNTPQQFVPVRIHGLTKAIDERLDLFTGTLVYTEEVKDGRSQKFDKTAVSSMIGSQFTIHSIYFTINSIRFKEEIRQGCDNQARSSTEYFNYLFEISISMKHQ